MLRPSDKAWVALAAGVVAWDVMCPPREMLSEASARYADRRPWLTRAVIGYTAAHLMNVIPGRVDLFTLTAKTFANVR